MSDIRTRIMQFTTQPVAVEVKDLGTMYIRRMTLGEMEKMQSDHKAGAALNKEPVSMAMRLLGQFLGDEKGERLFDVSKPEDLKVLQSIPVSTVAEVLKHGNKINQTDLEGKD